MSVTLIPVHWDFSECDGGKTRDQWSAKVSAAHTAYGRSQEEVLDHAISGAMEEGLESWAFVWCPCWDGGDCAE